MRYRGFDHYFGFQLNNMRICKKNCKSITRVFRRSCTNHLSKREKIPQYDTNFVFLVQRCSTNDALRGTEPQAQAQALAQAQAQQKHQSNAGSREQPAWCSAGGEGRCQYLYSNKNTAKHQFTTLGPSHMGFRHPDLNCPNPPITQKRKNSLNFHQEISLLHHPQACRFQQFCL